MKVDHEKIWNVFGSEEVHQLVWALRRLVMPAWDYSGPHVELMTFHPYFSDGEHFGAVVLLLPAKAELDDHLMQMEEGIKLMLEILGYALIDRVDQERD